MSEKNYRAFCRLWLPYSRYSRYKDVMLAGYQSDQIRISSQPNTVTSSPKKGSESYDAKLEV